MVANAAQAFVRRRRAERAVATWRCKARALRRAAVLVVLAVAAAAAGFAEGVRMGRPVGASRPIGSVVPKARIAATRGEAFHPGPPVTRRGGNRPHVAQSAGVLTRDGRVRVGDRANLSEGDAAVERERIYITRSRGTQLAPRVQRERGGGGVSQGGRRGRLVVLCHSGGNHFDSVAPIARVRGGERF